MVNRKLREEAFRLRSEENLTFNEIGLRLNLPCSTVKSWFFRAGITARSDDAETQSAERFTRPNQSISNLFSEEIQRLLSANPYVSTVSQSQIRFTQAFREEYWRRYKEGQEPKDILIALGIDPETLGESRLINLHKRISDAAANGLLGVNTEKGTSDLFADGVVPTKAMTQMRHELAYLRQEVEFIKKILSQGGEMKS